MFCSQQPQLSLTEEAQFNSAHTGQLSPTRIAASVSLCPSNVLGFSVSRQVLWPAGLVELALEERQAAPRKGATHVCTAGPALPGCQDHQFAQQASRRITEQALAAPFHAGRSSRRML